MLAVLKEFTKCRAEFVHLPEIRVFGVVVAAFVVVVLITSMATVEVEFCVSGEIIA